MVAELGQHFVWVAAPTMGQQLLYGCRRLCQLLIARSAEHFQNVAACYHQHWTTSTQLQSKSNVNRRNYVFR